MLSAGALYRRRTDCYLSSKGTQIDAQPQDATARSGPNWSRCAIATTFTHGTLMSFSGFAEHPDA